MPKGPRGEKRRSDVIGGAVKIMRIGTGEELDDRVVELKQQVRLHLPTCTPDQAIFALVLGRLPRLIS